MKKNNIFSIAPLAALVILSLFSCGICKKRQATAGHLPLTETYWKLVELNGKAIDNDSLMREPYIQFDSEQNRISGTGGCNGFGGTYKLTADNKIKFSELLSTMMACPKMEIEIELMDAIKQTSKYSILNNILSLQGPEKAVLAKFEAINKKDEVVFIKVGVPASMAKLDGEWELDHLATNENALEKLFPNKLPTIRFNTQRSHVSGNDGCNQYNGTYTLNGYSLRFGAMASTRMYCEGVNEAAFFQALEKINKYSISEDGKTLNLIATDIAIMRFARK